MKSILLIAFGAVIGATIVFVLCGRDHGRLPEIASGPAPSGPSPERHALDEFLQRVVRDKPAQALPDARAAARVGLAYHEAIWKCDGKSRKIGVTEIEDAWLISTDEVPPDAVGGNGYILLSKCDGRFLGAMHEL